MGKFVDNAMRPGSREFVILLNCVLGLLFCVMLTVVYTELENSIHAFIMLFIVVGLTLSINWFIVEANRLRDEQQQAADPHEKAPKPPTQRAKTD